MNWDDLKKGNKEAWRVVQEELGKENEKAWYEFQEEYCEIIYWYPVHKWRGHWHSFDKGLGEQYDNQLNVVQRGVFYDEVIMKLRNISKNGKMLIENFDPEKASFDTWLSQVLNSVRTDIIRRQQKDLLTRKPKDLKEKEKTKEKKDLFAGVISIDESIGTTKNGESIERSEEIKDNSASTEKQSEIKEMIEKLNTLIKKLSSSEKQVLKLWQIGYFEILPEDIKEIVEISGKSIPQVINEITEALSNLKEKRRTHLTADEIGKILNRTGNTVGVEIMRIRNYFRKNLRG